jgi:excisionase family DNA binding protein
METTVHIESVTIHTQVVGKPLFLSVAQAAAETGYSESYVRKLIHDGLLPHFKGEGNNGRVLIRTDELLAFMETRRVIPS